MASNDENQEDLNNTLLIYGYVRKIEMKYKFFMSIPNEITKTIYNFENIDIIYLSNDFSKSRNNHIQYIFKVRVINKITLYIGCNGYEIMNNNQIKLYSPYCYINYTKRWYQICLPNTKRWYHMAGKHLSYVLRLKYVKLESNTDPNVIPNQLTFSRKNAEKPELTLNYGTTSNQLHLSWIIMQTQKKYIMVE